MKIALINENSQASKNTLIYKELKAVSKKKDLMFSTTGCMAKKKKAS